MSIKFSAIVTDAMHRLQPHSPLPKGGAFMLPMARGQRLSCQVAVRVEGNDSPVAVRATSDGGDGLAVRIRRVGYVPVPHYNTPPTPGHFEGDLPGFVGDVLFDEDTLQAYNGETSAFWITVTADADCRPGRRRVGIDLESDGRARRLELVVHIADLTVAARQNFPVTHWFYADAILDFYKLTAFEKAFWPLLSAYFRNMAEHGQDTIYVPVFTPPLDGVKRPTQLLKVARTSAGRYRFDWSDVRKWIRAAKAAGLRNFEFTHLFTQWGAANAIRIYHGQGVDEKPLWSPKTPATGRLYRGFLSQYLPELEQFCRREKIMDRSFFHVSDEPHGADQRKNYAAARAMLRELAPWMKVMDALSEIEFAREGLVDNPIPSIRTAMEFLNAKPAPGRELPPPLQKPCWVYFCCGPRGKFLNRLMDTPLAKIRMSGWLFYKTAAAGFLHWGYNYWHRSQTREMIDPFTVSNGDKAPGWAYGDTFLVYPGPAGPLDSVRHEVFADSLQDYALLQTLGVGRDSAVLADIRDYQDFPFSPAWIAAARRALLAERLA